MRALSSSLPEAEENERGPNAIRMEESFTIHLGGQTFGKKKKKLRTLKSEKYSIFIHTNILHRKIQTFKVNKLTYGMP